MYTTKAYHKLNGAQRRKSRRDVADEKEMMEATIAGMLMSGKIDALGFALERVHSMTLKQLYVEQAEVAKLSSEEVADIDDPVRRLDRIIARKEEELEELREQRLELEHGGT